MNKAVLLAMACACFNTANDLVYRKSAIGREVKNVYLFYFYSSVFSAVFALILGYTESGNFPFEVANVFYGVILGILSFCAYIFFLFSFNGGDTTVSVTIYRLNLIPGIALAVIFLGEAITLRRGAGILLCIASVLLFAGKIFNGNSQKKYLLLGLAACLSGGILNMMNKVAVTHGVVPLQVMFWRFLTVGLISGVVLCFKKPGVLALKDLKFPVLSGLFLMMSVFCALEAFKTGADVSLVIPIGQMSIVMIAVISWAIFKEMMTSVKMAGILCAVLAIILIS